MNLYFPYLFVFFWSSAFISGQFIVQSASPFAALSFRFLIVSIFFLLFSFFFREKILVNYKLILQASITGVLFHGFYLGGVYVLKLNFFKPRDDFVFYLVDSEAIKFIWYLWHFFSFFIRLEFFEYIFPFLSLGREPELRLISLQCILFLVQKKLSLLGLVQLSSLIASQWLGHISF